MLRLLIIIGLLVLLSLLARRAVREFRRGLAKDRDLVRKDQMVQDPMCRTYIPAGVALEEEIEGHTYYFCSKECAQSYRKQLSA
jgi:YHS domain-containing protein